METHDLRKVGLKVTHPRMRILELLEQKSNQHHLSAEDIYRQLLDHGDEIGLATVYRVLTQFEAAGLVLKHNFEGGQAVYELDRGGHHDHMVDVDTGHVIEFEAKKLKRCNARLRRSMATSSKSIRWCCTCARSARADATLPQVTLTRRLRPPCACLGEAHR